MDGSIQDGMEKATEHGAARGSFEASVIWGHLTQACSQKGDALSRGDSKGQYSVSTSIDEESAKAGEDDGRIKGVCVCIGGCER